MKKKKPLLENLLRASLIVAGGMVAGCMSHSTSSFAKTITIDLADEEDECSLSTIQGALDRANDNDERTKYKIIVPPGTYKTNFPNGLHIYSNTTLDLTGSTIKRAKGTPIGAMIQVGYPRREGGATGYTKGGYTRGHDIKVIGGKFDAGKELDQVTTLCTFSHVKNIAFQNTTFQYLPKARKSAHLVEFGASKNVTFSKCKFIGNQRLGEAVQIESAIKGVAGSELMGKTDGTKTSNVTLEGCLFQNFEYAFGTNHGCSKDVYTGFVLKKNNFTKISKYAVCMYNYRGIRLIGNKLNGGALTSKILNLGQKNTVKYK